MLMRVAKSGAHSGNGLGGFFPHGRRQLARRFLDSFREQNPGHTLPAKVSSLPALRDDAISAKAESSAAVAWASVTPYSSNAGKSLGRNGRPRNFTICAKNMDTAAVGVMPISRQTWCASSASWLSIRSLICSVMYQMCHDVGGCQVLEEAMRFTIYDSRFTIWDSLTQRRQERKGANLQLIFDHPPSPGCGGQAVSHGPAKYHMQTSRAKDGHGLT